MRDIKLVSVFSLFLALVLGLGNSSSHPTAGNSGYTGAPGDNVCASCHGGSNPSFNGEVSINGLPAVIMTNTSYTITVTISNPNGNASRAGFQMLALTGSNTNAGTMSNNSASTQIKTVGGKNYFGHSPSSNFSGNQSQSFTVNWTAPATTGSNPVINFYASALLANGNGSTSGDKMVLTTVTVPIQAAASPLTVSVVPVASTSCTNTSDGSASVNITGGMGPYGITWSNGQTNTQTAINLPPGQVSVTVTDADGVSATGSTIIQAPQAINITTSSTPACANTNNGTASALATGGTGSLSYFWSNGMQGPQIAGLQAGTYSVSVFDANNCFQTSMVTVGSFPVINISENIQNVSCNGGNNGVINLNVSGGTGNFNYLWSSGQTGGAIGNLLAGTYTVTVTSNNQCSTTRTYIITQPAPLINTVQNITGAGCEGQSNGTATLSTSGGTAPYQISIQNLGNFSGSIINLQNLPAGTYSYTITDQNNCVITDSFQITSFPALSATVELNYNVCGDVCFVNASTSVSGGSLPYSFIWYDGQTNQNPVLGCYPGSSVTITDQNGCFTTVNFVIDPPPPLSIDTITVNNPACNGQPGSAIIQTNGGIGNPTVLWSDGTTGNTRSDLSPGEYFFTVTDANMCEVTDSLIIIEPELLIVEVEITNASESGVSDGQIILDISGGTAPFTVIWNNGQTGSALDSIPAGIYFFTVTDSNNCSNSGNAVVNNSFCFIAAEVESIHPTCFDDNNGQILVTPLSDEHLPSVRLFNSAGQELTEFDSLVAGIYNILITDTLGCIGSVDSILINNPPSIIADSIIAIQPSSDMSSDGIISAYITGGTGSLSYQWYLNDWPYSNESHIEDLPNGIYNLVVTDSAGCQAMFGPFNFLLVSNKDHGKIYDDIRVYPNPVTDYMHIEWNENMAGHEIIIVAPDGKYIPVLKDEQSNSNIISIDLNNFMPGLYTLIIYNGNFRSFRVIKI